MSLGYGQFVVIQWVKARAKKIVIFVPINWVIHTGKVIFKTCKT
jgi:hypothetical protein